MIWMKEDAVMEKKRMFLLMLSMSFIYKSMLNSPGWLLTLKSAQISQSAGIPIGRLPSSTNNALYMSQKPRSPRKHNIELVSSRLSVLLLTWSLYYSFYGARSCWKDRTRCKRQLLAFYALHVTELRRTWSRFEYVRSGCSVEVSTTHLWRNQSDSPTSY